MNGDHNNQYYDNILPFHSAHKKSGGKSSKKRFLVKLKKRFFVLKDWRKSEVLIKNAEPSKYRRFELSQGIDQIEECIFYYVNGVIQMATFPRSAN